MTKLRQDTGFLLVSFFFLSSVKEVRQFNTKITIVDDSPRVSYSEAPPNEVRTWMGTAASPHDSDG